MKRRTDDESVVCLVEIVFRLLFIMVLSLRPAKRKTWAKWGNWRAGRLRLCSLELLGVSKPRWNQGGERGQRAHPASWWWSLWYRWLWHQRDSELQCWYQQQGQQEDVSWHPDKMFPDYQIKSQHSCSNGVKWHGVAFTVWPFPWRALSLCSLGLETLLLDISAAGWNWWRKKW